MITTIIIFLVILSILVFVHEFGHFFVAKRSGMKVMEFGFGFPPRLFGLQKVGGSWKIVWGNKEEKTDDTVYSVNAIPLGGFVKIMGEDNDTYNDPRSFVNKPFLIRFLALAAGVIMNVILAWALFSVGFMYGLPIAVGDKADIPAHGTFSDERVAVIAVQPESPAERDGLQASDIIQSVDGQTFGDIYPLQEYINQNRGKEFEFTVQRVNETKTITVASNANPAPDEGSVGINMAVYGKLQFPVHYALIEGAKTTYYQFTAILTGLYDLFTSGVGLQSLGGPVKIAQLTGQVADLGIIPLLQFAGFLSLNLAILNSIPLPALDGGRMLFLIIEKIRGKRNNQKIEQYANAIGFMFLLLLMLVITVRDVYQIESVKNLFS